MKKNKFNFSRQNFISNGNNKRIKNEKLRNILSWLLIGILCLTIIGSVLGTIAFGKTYSANADNVSIYYRYEGSNFFAPISAYKRDRVNSFYTSSPYLLSVDTVISSYNFYIGAETSLNRVTTSIPFFKVRTGFRDKYMQVYYASVNNADFINDEQLYFNGNVTGDTQYYIPCSPNDDIESEYYGYVDHLTVSNVPIQVIFCNSNGSIDNVSQITSDTYYTMYGFFSYDDYSTSGFEPLYGRFFIKGDVKFNRDVYCVKFTSEVLSIPGNTRRTVANRVTYLDSNDYSLTVTYYYDYNSTGSGVRVGDVNWEDRTYYLSDVLDDKPLYKEGYNAGVNDGKILGVEEYKFTDKFLKDARDNYFNLFVSEYKGSSEYKLAIDNAKLDGYYQAQGEDSETFTAVLSAMYNAPLGAFRDFISFELLGIDMLGFFTGLFTIAFILFVIKKLT